MGIELVRATCRTAAERMMHAERMFMYANSWEGELSPEGLLEVAERGPLSATIQRILDDHERYLE
ncbi:unnamed protein product, partial [Amoebophrya sp. A25]|eukprot:GSA25T00004634001.1